MPDSKHASHRHLSRSSGSEFDEPELSAVIVNFNSSGVLAECLQSLAEYVDCRYEAIVVDNASSPDDVRNLHELAASHDNAKFLYLDENAGYGAANNMGINLARGRFVLLLNPDTRLTQPGIEALADELSDRVGLVACRLDNPDGTLQESLYRFPSLGVAAGQALLLHKILPASAASRFAFSGTDHDTMQRPDWVPGAFMLCRRETLEQLDGFDESIFMYGEDLDLCFRLRQLGLSVLYVPDFAVMHRGGYSQGQVWSDSEREVRVYKALFAFYRAHYGRLRLLAARTAWSIGALLRMTGYALSALRPGRGSRTLHEAKTQWRVFLAQFGFDHPPRHSRQRVALTLCIAVALLLGAAGLRIITATRARAVPVLIYHNVLPADGASRRGMEAGAPVLSPESFEAHLRWLEANGYTTVTLDQVADFAEGRGSLPDKPVAVTFDDGSEGVYRYALPLLRKYNAKATVFLITSWIREPGHPLARKEQRTLLDWRQARALQASGLVDVESHTFDLHQISRRGQAQTRGPLVTARLLDGSGLESADAYRHRIAADFEADKAVFQRELGRKPTFLAWPYGASTREAAGIARRAGYRACFATDMGEVTSGSDTSNLPRVLLEERDGAGLDGALLEARYVPELSSARQSIKDLLRPPAE